MKGKPVVMCFSGLDPTGGAGLQADMETLLSLGCHCAPVATAMTVQNTRNASRIIPTDPDLIEEQARAILADMPVRCFKLGLLGSIDLIRKLQGLLREYADIPVIMDPVSAAGGGYEFAGEEVLTAMRESLIPLATVLTPNSMELAQLTQLASGAEFGEAAKELLRAGCGHVLLTGGHESGKEVLNRWFQVDHEPVAFRWPRLEHEYHGSGCTLAAAIAGNLALGNEMEDALRLAQEFTWNALDHGFRPGAGQHLPDRGFARNS